MLGQAVSLGKHSHRVRIGSDVRVGPIASLRMGPPNVRYTPTGHTDSAPPPAVTLEERGRMRVHTVRCEAPFLRPGLVLPAPGYCWLSFRA